MATPSPEVLRRYADSLAWHQLTSHAVDPYGRQITVAFGPTARSNLDALRSWIYMRLLEANPEPGDLAVDSDLGVRIADRIRDRLEEVFLSD